MGRRQDAGEKVGCEAKVSYGEVSLRDKVG